MASFNRNPKIITVYQCPICKVIFELEEQCHQHQEAKHLNKKDLEFSTNLDLNTADIVKLHKRSSSIKNLHCQFCLKELPLYTPSITLNNLPTCKKCLVNFKF